MVQALAALSQPFNGEGVERAKAELRSSISRVGKAFRLDMSRIRWLGEGALVARISLRTWQGGISRVK